MSTETLNQGSDDVSLPVWLEFERVFPFFGYQTPVQLRVGNASLIAGSAEGVMLQHGMRLKVPAFATWGLACLRVARSRGRATLDLDDYGSELMFKAEGSSILILSNWTLEQVKVDYDIILAAWHSFAMSVREEVLRREPDRESWGYWDLISDDPPQSFAAYLGDKSRYEDAYQTFTERIEESQDHSLPAPDEA
ncbi:MAG TPA: hypothetical protein VKJ45_23080 [Blastocatellia bacterium]|nr:hypothetical protein [Blastocatellia bacterium]